MSTHPVIVSTVGNYYSISSSSSGGNGRQTTSTVHTLQQRLKWRTSQCNLQVDDLVTVKDDHTSPLQWPLAIVIAIHQSTHDDLVRVVTIRTAHSTYKRPITKLLKLPIEHQ